MPASEREGAAKADAKREEKIWSKSFNSPGCWFGCGSSDLQFAPIHHSVTLMALLRRQLRVSRLQSRRRVYF